MRPIFVCKMKKQYEEEKINRTILFGSNIPIDRDFAIEIHHM